MTYRCRACRQYHRDEPYRRVGLGSVCSEECLKATSQSPRRATPKAAVLPDVRAAVLTRDRHRCRYCGCNDSLHLHHVHYRSEGGEHHERNLITLCTTHHALIHSDKRRWQPLCQAYIDGAHQGRLAFLVDLDSPAGGGR